MCKFYGVVLFYMRFSLRTYDSIREICEPGLFSTSSFDCSGCNIYIYIFLFVYFSGKGNELLVSPGILTNRHIWKILKNKFCKRKILNRVAWKLGEYNCVSSLVGRYALNVSDLLSTLFSRYNDIPIKDINISIPWKKSQITN